MARVMERSSVPPEEYLSWERAQQSKHEYWDSRISAEVRTTPRHNNLAARVGGALERAPGRHVFGSNQQLQVGHARLVYADAVVVRGPVDIVFDDVITNPTVIVEVLSSSTEQYDRGLKWDAYQTRESLTDYVLVSQDRARIEHFGRKDAASSWTYTAAGAGQVITLVDGTVLDVDAIFAGVFELKGDDPVELGEAY